MRFLHQSDLVFLIKFIRLFRERFHFVLVSRFSHYCLYLQLEDCRSGMYPPKGPTYCCYSLLQIFSLMCSYISDALCSALSGAYMFFLFFFGLSRFKGNVTWYTVDLDLPASERWTQVIKDKNTEVKLFNNVHVSYRVSHVSYKKALICLQ